MVCHTRELLKVSQLGCVLHMHAHLPPLSKELHTHYGDSCSISHTSLSEGGLGLQLTALAQGTLPLACEAREPGEAILWRPTHVCSNLQGKLRQLGNSATRAESKAQHNILVSQSGL